jgi:hypothetical protein
MPTNEENINMLIQSVIRLASNKVDSADLTALNNIHTTRYVDLKTAYENLTTRVNNLELWISNHITGNTI